MLFFLFFLNRNTNKCPKGCPARSVPGCTALTLPRMCKECGTRWLLVFKSQLHFPGMFAGKTPNTSIYFQSYHLLLSCIWRLYLRENVIIEMKLFCNAYDTVEMINRNVEKQDNFNCLNGAVRITLLSTDMKSPFKTLFNLQNSR